MNLDLFKQQLVGETASRMSWEELDNNGDNVVMKANFTLRAFDDEIVIVVDFNKDGELSVIYTFDTIEYNKDTLKLINHFNRYVSFLKSYIAVGRRANYLKVIYECPHCSTIEDACEMVLFSLKYLEEDDTVKYLQPLTVITEE